VPGRAIYDDRYAEAKRFAAVLAGRGVPARALDDGDVTRWYEELDALWRRDAFAVAGLTQFGPMLVVERLAAERRMGLAMRVEHRVTPDGALAHVVTAPRDVAAHAASFVGAARADLWPELMAALVFRVSGEDAPHETSAFTTPAAAPRLAAEPAPAAASIIHYYAPHAIQQGYGLPLDGPLYSWVVGPRSRG
jgi:hypothetical protein